MCNRWAKSERAQKKKKIREGSEWGFVLEALYLFSERVIRVAPENWDSELLIFYSKTNPLQGMSMSKRNCVVDLRGFKDALKPGLRLRIHMYHVSHNIT